jgi:ketosteroid isomerase-like protein
LASALPGRHGVTLSDTDRLDILEVVARADAAATRRDADAYVSLFTDDAVLDGEKGEHRGKERLRRSVGPIWESEGPSSVHVTLNAVVESMGDQPDRAVATSVLLILQGTSPIVIHSASAITQHLVKTGSSWLIERRSVAPATGTNG